MRKLRLRFPKNTFNSVSLAVIGAAIVLLVAGIIYYVQQNQQKAAINRQTASTNALILEVKNLEIQNKKLNQTSNNYAYCNAILVAKYTQDQRPIFIQDLNRCIFKSFPRGLGPNQTTQSNAQSFLNPQAQSSPATVLQPAGTAPPAQPSNMVLTTPDILPLNTPCLNLLGIKNCK